MFLGTLAAILVGLALGFVFGGLIYRQSRRWCPACGATTTELTDQHREASAT
jgi:hypothetical protein